MQIPVDEAASQLGTLVQQVQAGEEVILVRNGEPAARLQPIPSPLAGRRDPAALLEAIAEIQRSAALHVTPGPCAARSQDFLYDEDGLPA